MISMVFRNIRGGSIFTRLVVTFLVVIIPIYSSSLWINKNAKESVKLQISESISSRVHYYLGAFEQQWSKIFKFQQHFLIDDDIKYMSELPYLTDYEKLRSIVSLQDKLGLMEDANSFIQNVKLYIPSIKSVITKTGYSNHMEKDDLTVTPMVKGINDSPFILQGDRLLLSEYYRNQGQGNILPSFALEVELSKSEIQRSLLQVIDPNEGDSVLFDQHLKWNIATDHSAPLVTTIKQYLSEISPLQTEKGSAELFVDRKAYFISYEQSKMLGTILVVCVPENNILGPLNKYRNWMWFLSIMAFMIVLFFSYNIFRVIHQPLNRLVKAFRRVESGDLNMTIAHKQYNEFHYLYQHFNKMVERLKVLIHEVYEQQIRSQRAELKQLQSQINPHFLYNSFFTLSHLAMVQDYESLSKMSRLLGEYFRFITRNDSDDVDLSKEFSHAKSYADIQYLRFSNRLTLSWEPLLDSYKDLKIPRLIIQPIIENAFIHGLEGKEADGLLQVSLTAKDQGLTITVEDNGDHVTEELIEKLNRCLERNSAEMTGLLNVHFRLKLKFGQGYGLSFKRSSLGGLRVDMYLPTEVKETE